MLGRKMTRREEIALGVFIPPSSPNLFMYYSRDALRPFAFCGTLGISPEDKNPIYVNKLDKIRSLGESFDGLTRVAEGDLVLTPQFIHNAFT